MVKSFIDRVQHILENVPEADRHRECLKMFSNKGMRFSYMINEIPTPWLENYTDSKYEPRINLIERLKNVLVAEFDEPLEEGGLSPSEALKKAESTIKKNGWQYIRSTHKGKCDYLWLEFTEPISDEEAERFLYWLCPKGARIDANFASSVRVFPVLFAPHRKHPHIEEPLYIVDGKLINFKSLKLPKVKPKVKTENKDGYQYQTIEKGHAVTKEIPKESLQLLKDPNLFKIITEKELGKKIEGELKSRKAIFLSLCSIWNYENEIPINTMVSSESSTGKSFVCKKIIQIFPKELVVYRSKITGEAFTYWHTNEDNWTWDGKICYLEDISQTVLDSPTFKVMCSEGSIATVVRNQKAIDLTVNGKPSMIVTTARTNPNIEVINRFQIVQLDETTKQTFEITKKQAEQKVIEEYDENITKSLRYLKRKKVFIPYGLAIHSYLNEHYSFDDLRMRRDFSRLLDLIRNSTVLYQFQRQEDAEGRLIATEQDYEIAREVINYITGATLKGLTNKLGKAFDACQKENLFTVKDIHAKHPIASLQQWYDYLDNLCERGLLSTELRDIGGYERDGRIIGAKPITYYKVLEKKSFNLPNYETLFKEFPDGFILIGKSGKIGLNGLNGLNGSDQFNQINQLNVKVGGSSTKKDQNSCIICGSLDARYYNNINKNKRYCKECFNKL